jgi:orotate phosphoribosyltransferase
MSQALEIAKLLLDIKAVALNTESPFRYSSGILSPIYCDNRLIISYPEKRKKIITAFLSLIAAQKINFDVVAGVATAGIPHAAWIADALNKPMVYVRAQSKGHGKQNQVEGLIEKNQTALLIEDHISTGGSSVAAGIALREAGAIVTDCLAISSYSFQNAQENFAQAGIRLQTLTHFAALLEAAEQNGYIRSEEKTQLTQWQKDPLNWEKNYAQKI